MCKNTAIYRYTWPGRDESFICEEHASKLLDIANVMGLYLQLIPLSKDQEIKCQQQTEE